MPSSPWPLPLWAFLVLGLVIRFQLRLDTGQFPENTWWQEAFGSGVNFENVKPLLGSYASVPFAI